MTSLLKTSMAETRGMHIESSGIGKGYMYVPITWPVPLNHHSIIFWPARFFLNQCTLFSEYHMFGRKDDGYGIFFNQSNDA